VGLKLRLKTAKSVNEETMSVKQAIGNEKTSEIAIFARLIKADEGNLTRGLASYLLTLGFDEDDQARMSDLAGRNQDGNIGSGRGWTIDCRVLSDRLDGGVRAGLAWQRPPCEAN
jgi:hypothetical protein